MKKSKGFIIAFAAPVTLSLLIMYLYPVVRTVLMSFFGIESVTGSMSDWTFNGVDNYIKIFSSPTFQRAMTNMFLIWVVGGIIVLAFALLFAVILTSGIRFKKFFRAIGLEGKNWLGTDMKFWAMLFAFIFGAVGYYMLIFISGIERIPEDLYEAATIDGANKFQQFFSMTLPLLRSIFKTNITFWSVNCISFFLWSKMFSPIASEASTMVPVVYLYDTVFGTTGSVQRDAGAGAAVGVTLAVFVAIIYFIMNKVLKDDDLEF